MAPPLNLHASAVVVGESGVLIRGTSGAGKSRLALATVAEATRQGRFARLVADDRTLVEPCHGRLVARPHPALAGRVERRGLGLVMVLHERACVIRLAVDLCEGWPERLPAPEDRRTEVAGITMPRLAIAVLAASGDGAALILAALDEATMLA